MEEKRLGEWQVKHGLKRGEIEERAEEYAKRKSGCQPWQYASSAYRSYKQIYIEVAVEQEAIDNKRKDVLLQYLEELEAHYRDLGQYDDGKPIRRVIEYIKAMEE